MMHGRRNRLFAFAAIIGIALVSAGCAGRGGDVENAVAGSASPGTPQEFQITVGDRILFSVDSAELSPQARATLDRQSVWLNQYAQFTFTIEGHADERGTREYNLALGARRAAAVEAYLTSRGVAGNRMKTISYGKERPVAVCNDISCWSQNRRAVTVLNAAGS